MRLHFAYHFLDEAAEWLHVPYATDTQPRFNIAPGQRILAVCNDSATRFSWGNWNATIEPAEQISQRCIVPSTGFYLWTEDGTPMFVSRTDRKPVFFAATWRMEEAVRVYELLTAPAEERFVNVHPTMPLLLQRDAWRPWLSRNAFSNEEMRTLLQPDRSLPLGLIRVSELVNDPANDRRACMLPA